MIAGLLIGLAVTVLAGVSVCAWTAVFLEYRAEKARGGHG